MTAAVTPNPIDPYPSSGISVIITGAGVAGLYFAMECIRQGHKPIIIESRRKELEPEGDYFVIGHSATKNLKYWPKFKKSYDAYAQDTWLNYFRHDGSFIDGPMPAQESLGKIFIRKQMHEMMMAEVLRQNITIMYGDKVVDYYETSEGAGVVLASGLRMEADLVAAADGVHSRSWRIVNGNKEEPISSGFSILRASMTIERAYENQVVKAKWGNVTGHDTLEFLFGPDTHANLVMGKGSACWLLMHKDVADETSSESWNNTISVEEALKIINVTPSWDPDFLELVKQSTSIVDWRLMMRNPQPNWVSKNGRIIQVGDSAHPFLPTSANGATQAMEDAVSLATCLRLGGGRDGIPTATRTHNKLRFDRVSCSQLGGLLKREEAHKIDWEAVAKNPGILRKITPGTWLAIHDPEQYALDRFEECKDALLRSLPFNNTNIPPGYTVRPWDVFQILRDADAGKLLVLEGEW